MVLDRIGEVGDKANEGQAAGMYGAGFVSCRNRSGINVGSDKKLMEMEGGKM